MDKEVAWLIVSSSLVLPVPAELEEMAVQEEMAAQVGRFKHRAQVKLVTVHLEALEVQGVQVEKEAMDPTE